MAPAVQWGLETAIHPGPSRRKGELNGAVAKTGNFVAVLFIEEDPAAITT